MGQLSGTYTSISYNKNKYEIEKKPGSKRDYGGFGSQIDLAGSELYWGLFIKQSQPLLTGIIYMLRQRGDK